MKVPEAEGLQGGQMLEGVYLICGTKKQRKYLFTQCKGIPEIYAQMLFARMIFPGILGD